VPERDNASLVSRLPLQFACEFTAYTNTGVERSGVPNQDFSLEVFIANVDNFMACGWVLVAPEKGAKMAGGKGPAVWLRDGHQRRM
jgi:hypothetical protein